MTRTELFEKLLAKARFQSNLLRDRHEVLTGLKALGLIDFEEDSDAAFVSACVVLTGREVKLVSGKRGVVSGDGAFDLLDLLRKNGFRILR